jgi:hypothetical protein
MSGQTSPAKPKIGTNTGNRGLGRPKGAVNKNTAAIKDMITQALNEAGGVAYLQRQAEANPAAFMTLVGKVIPLQVNGPAHDGAHVVRVVLEGVPAK